MTTLAEFETETEDGREELLVSDTSAVRLLEEMLALLRDLNARLREREKYGHRG